MEKLDELKAIALQFESHEVKPMPVYPEDILYIVEAYRALEQDRDRLASECVKHNNMAFKYQQRSEAAEAKLAQLEKQPPIAWTEECEITNMQATGLYLRGFPDNSQGRNIGLFTRPAPTADLAELVPDELTPKQASRSYGGEVVGYRDGWNACRAAILQSIAQADRDKFFKFLKDTSAIVDSWPDWKKQGSDVVKFLSQSPPAGVVDDSCPKGSDHEWVHHAPCYNPDYEECNKCGQRKECSENE